MKRCSAHTKCPGYITHKKIWKNKTLKKYVSLKKIYLSLLKKKLHITFESLPNTLKKNFLIIFSLKFHMQFFRILRETLNWQYLRFR